VDPVTVTYYATICACLAAAAGRLTRVWLRVAVGAAVGLVAAGVLPFLRAAGGF
jgi:hypothetical protein